MPLLGQREHPTMTRYTEASNKGSVLESASPEDLTITEIRHIIDGSLCVLVRHVSEPDGSLGCGDIVLKDPDDLEEIAGDEVEVTVTIRHRGEVKVEISLDLEQAHPRGRGAGRRAGGRARGAGGAAVHSA
jgi:hypothetical protein